MSDSDSDVDFEIRVPKGARLRGKRGQNAAANNGNKGTKGKPLATNNNISEDDDDEVESPGRPRKGRKRPSDPKWDQQKSSSEEEGPLNLDSDVEDRSDHLKKGENRPPQNGQRTRPERVDSSDEESIDHRDQRGKKANPKLRKRLSVRPVDTSRLSIVGNQNVEAPQPPTDPATLKKIYSSCIEMFNAQKINSENAFQLKFLELMGDIIDLPEFDKNDMLGAGRMLEAGAKIYVCRVEKTKLSVMDLATTLNMQQRNKKRGGENNDDDDGAANGEQGAGGDGTMMEQEDGQQKNKAKRKKKMKQNRFIADNDTKITLPIELDSYKGGQRRAALKIEFQKFIDQDLDFDYFNEYLADKEKNVRPATIEEQQQSFANEPLIVPETAINLAEISNLEQIRFVLMENFKPDQFDVWGYPANSTDADMDNNLQEPGPTISPEPNDQPIGDSEGLAYAPSDEQPIDYDRDADNLEDDQGFENHTFVNDDGIVEGSQEPPTRKLGSLEDFFELYSANSDKFSCGPMFIKTQRFNFMQLKNGVKKPRVKKDPVYLDVKGVNFKSHIYKYLTNKSGKTVFDELALERWSTGGRPPTPYLKTEDLDGEDYDKLEDIFQEGRKEIPDLFKFFVDSRRNVFTGFTFGTENDVEEDRFQQHNRDEDQYVNDAGFEVERHHDDFANDDGPMDDHMDRSLPGEYHSPDAPFNSSFSFPVSLGLAESERESTTKTSEGADSLRFVKKPKPIDMHALKRAIFQFLGDTLQFEKGGKPILEGETRTDFISLVKYVFQHVDKKTHDHLSISIIVVGLLHVVVDNKLFLLPNLEEPTNPLIVCRGSLWIHGENIPMPMYVDDDDDE